MEVPYNTAIRTAEDVYVRQGDIILSIILYYPVESYRLNSHTYRIMQDNGQDDVTLLFGTHTEEPHNGARVGPCPAVGYTFPGSICVGVIGVEGRVTASCPLSCIIMYYPVCVAI